MQARKMLGWLRGIDREQAGGQFRRQDTVDNVDMVVSANPVVDAVSDQFVVGFTDDFCHSVHYIGDERPCKRRDQYTDKPAASSRQARCGDAADEALLLDNTQNTVSCSWIHIGFMV